MNRSVLIVAILLSLNSSHCLADRLREYSIAELCWTADLIIDCQLTERDKAKILKVYKASKDLGENCKEIEVQDLSRHDQFLLTKASAADKAQTRTYVRKTLFLFLRYDEASKSWISVGGERSAEGIGSSGAIWYDDTKIYAYRQRVSSGPLVLTDDGRDPRSIRREIESGLALWKEWEACLANRASRTRADCLSKYLLARTSPAGREQFYRFRARNALIEMKEAAVPPVVELIKNRQPGDDLRQAVRVLQQLGPLAIEGAPVLRELINRPMEIATLEVFRALRDIEGRTVAPIARKLLVSDDAHTRADAATTLGMFNDTEAAPDVAKAVIGIWNQKNQYFVCDILIALRQLDYKRAEPLIKKAENDPDLMEIKPLLRMKSRKLSPKPPEEQF